MDVKINWLGGLKFEGAADSGFVQTMESGPGSSAPAPMEFIAMGLAGCTAMDVISILEKKRQPVKSFEVMVHADRAAEHPKVFTRAVIEYQVTGTGVDEAAVIRAIELSAVKYCPAQAMLVKAFPIQMAYKIFDENGVLTAEGEYLPQAV